jgi:hypothetical protein
MFEADNGAAPAAAEPTPVAAPAETTPAPAPQPEAPALSADERMDATMRAAWDKLHPARAPDGKFTAKDAPAEAEAAPAEPVTEPEPATEASPAPAGEAPKMPVSWPKEQAEAWAKLDKPAQEYILRREGEFEKGIQAKTEKFKPYEELDKVFEPWRERWQLEGASPAVKVQQLLAAQAYLDRNPVEAIQWLAQSYGVNLGQTGQQPVQQQPQDPVIRKIQELDEWKAQQENASRAQAEASLKTEIDGFKASGKAPHFDAVRADMAKLLQAGAVETLQDAYDRAVWANPTTRALVLEEQRKAEAAKAAEEAKKAKAAASVNVRSTPTASARPKTLDDTLTEIARRHYQQ